MLVVGIVGDGGGQGPFAEDALVVLAEFGIEMIAPPEAVIVELPEGFNTMASIVDLVTSAPDLVEDERGNRESVEDRLDKHLLLLKSLLLLPSPLTLVFRDDDGSSVVGGVFVNEVHHAPGLVLDVNTARVINDRGNLCCCDAGKRRHGPGVQMRDSMILWDSLV